MLFLDNDLHFLENAPLVLVWFVLTACPGSTSTELKSPQRPHCRLIFIGSLMTGVVTCASALMPCALSSALVMGGCRGLGLNGAMVPLVLCGQYVCSLKQRLYSPQ